MAQSSQGLAPVLSLVTQLCSPLQDAAWMGQKDQPVEGSDWQGGYQTMRKGVWIWGEPFWVQGPHGKVSSNVEWGR